jgi:hypothetical protein
MIRPWLAAFFTALTLTAALAEEEFQVMTSKKAQVALLEMFTSEGCSGCPPADKWLGSFKDHQGLWTDFIPVALHVDYWDRLGWVDPYGSAEFTQRQRDYASYWGSGRVYTPGFVLNGKEWLGFFDGSGSMDIDVWQAGVLELTLKGQQATVRFAPVKDAGGQLEVVLALLGTGLKREIKRGENRGMILEHNFVALEYKRVPLQKSKDVYLTQAALHQMAAGEPQPTAVVAWVAPAGGLSHIQAVGGWLGAKE